MKIISIHALREEGDASACWPWALPARFQSTPSARRATALLMQTGVKRVISIHALREEGDPNNARNGPGTLYFNPRPPRGGRRPIRSTSPPQSGYFNPRPPRGGRRARRKCRTTPTVFQSTPSARRATVMLDKWHSVMLISIHALREEGDR